MTQVAGAEHDGHRGSDVAEREPPGAHGNQSVARVASPVASEPFCERTAVEREEAAPRVKRTIRCARTLQNHCLHVPGCKRGQGSLRVTWVGLSEVGQLDGLGGKHRTDLWVCNLVGRRNEHQLGCPPCDRGTKTKDTSLRVGDDRDRDPRAPDDALYEASVVAHSRGESSFSMGRRVAHSWTVHGEKTGVHVV